MTNFWGIPGERLRKLEFVPGGNIPVILAHLATSLAHVPASLGMYFEEAQVSFSVMGLWGNMGWLARCVVVLLFIMSIWSLAVIIDRALYFSAARKQSREFAPKV